MELRLAWSPQSSPPLTRAALGCLAAALASFSALAFRASDAHAAFGVTGAEVGTCKEEGCTYASTEPDNAFFTQAAGRTIFGLTAFSITTNAEGVPEGDLKRVRVDLPPGTSFNPQAVEQCPQSIVAEGEEAIKEHCKESEIGKVRFSALEVRNPPAFIKNGITPLFNVEPPPGHPLELYFAPVGIPHTIVGGVSWHHEPALEAKGVSTGDYHEYFESTVPESPQVISFKFIVLGQAGKGFLTVPSECNPNVTSHLTLESYGHAEAPGQVPEGVGPEVAETFTTTPVGPANCQNVPFEPLLSVAPSTTQLDTPDAATVGVHVPHPSGPTQTEIDNSDVKSLSVTLPPGMTLNPAVATGLEACTSEEFGEGTAEPIRCPEGSKLGTFAIQTPDLPPGSLNGEVYVGQPLSGDAQSGQEYRIFLDAASATYGLDFRFEGHVSANPVTGQLTAALVDLPQLPFTNATVHLDGPHVPLANPLTCGPATATSELQAYASYPGRAPAAPDFTFPYGGNCSPAVPFSPTQSAASTPAAAGASGAFTYGVGRNDGQQFLDQITTALPQGLLGRIPDATLCPEAQANAGACPSSSQIGTLAAALGAGPSPLMLPGAIYLTGPYDGAPYGLSIAVSAEHVGPYDYGVVVTRAGIGIDPFTARVTVSTPSPGSPGAIPLIVGGAPLRLRAISLSVDRPGFTVNPTSCGGLVTESSLAGSPGLPLRAGATAQLRTPFETTGCSALAFKPSFAASTSAKTSRANGASLQVTLAPVAGNANVREVAVALPSNMPSRETTLTHACSEAQFDANPAGCPAPSRVANATLSTPLLPAPLTGPGILVSRGGAAFPDLDFVLEGNGVKLIEVSHTNIKNGITSSTFPALPDAPFTSFRATFPTGADSLFAANGSLCSRRVTTHRRVLVRRHGKPVRRHGHLVHRRRTLKRQLPIRLTMPATLVGQNGARLSQSTRISVGGCPRTESRRVRVLRVRVRGRSMLVTVAAPAAGRIRVSGRYVRRSSKHVRRASRATVRVHVGAAGASALRHRHRLRLRLKVAFTASARGVGSSHVFVTARLR